MRNSLSKVSALAMFLVAWFFAADLTFSQEGKAPSLPGTYWQLISLTKKGEAIKDAQNPADVEFLADGKWGVLHYGGRREAGTYVVKGDHLTMKTEDGEEYMAGSMVLTKDKILEIRSSDGWLMRLRFFKDLKKK